MDVSIILVSYNTRDLTENCLRSVYEKTSDINFDVWVIDNASSDGSAQMIKDKFPQVNLIESSENLGFGRANNVVINKVQSKYVFLLNTDTILLNNAVKILYDVMEKPKNVDVGACGGQLYNRDMTLQYSTGEFDTLAKLCKKTLGIKIKDKISHSVRGEPDYIIGADLMLRKSALDKCGVFDERFFMYGEEAELCLRLKKNGYKMRFNPKSQILHYGGASSYSQNTQIQVEKMILKNVILFYEIAYGKECANKARLLYIIYYLRYLPLRFFSIKAFKRLKMALEVCTC